MGLLAFNPKLESVVLVYAIVTIGGHHEEDSGGCNSALDTPGYRGLELPPLREVEWRLYRCLLRLW